VSFVANHIITILAKIITSIVSLSIRTGTQLRRQERHEKHKLSLEDARIHRLVINLEALLGFTWGAHSTHPGLIWDNPSRLDSRQQLRGSPSSQWFSAPSAGSLLHSHNSPITSPLFWIVMKC